MNLHTFIKNELHLPLNSPKARVFVQDTIRYICGASDANTYQRKLKVIVSDMKLPVSAKVLRLTMMENSYFLLNIKFFAFNMLMRTKRKDTINRYALNFEVEPRDVELIVSSITGSFRRDVLENRRFDDITLEMVDIGSIEKVREEFNSFYTDLKNHARFKVYKKLRFLINSENLEFSDFQNDLMFNAVCAYYKMVPTTKTMLHRVNYLRSSINNRATNIISERTADKRRRMDNEGTDDFGAYKFALNCVSENQLNVNSESGEEIGLESIGGVVELDTRILDELNMEGMLRTYGTTDTRRRIIQIMYGEYEPRFSRYLANRGVIKGGEDCSDFVHRNQLKTIVRRLSDHLHVQEYKLNLFMELIGTAVQETRSAAW